MRLSDAQRMAPQRRGTGVRDGDYFALDGGLNLTATPLTTKPGELIGVVNYEPRTLGGYRRFQGYERLDGRQAPSTAQYWIISYTSGVPANYPTVGQTVNGATSGATGIVLATNVDNPTGTGYCVLGRVSGNFVAAESLRVSTTVFATSTTTANAQAAPTETLDQAYAFLAQQDLRGLIQAVPGSGPVRGVVVYHGVVYAFRDNAGATACVMWKATTGGWSQIPTYYKLRFTVGTAGLVDGAVIVGATSSATATVRRVVVQSGSLAGGTATGFVILSANAAFVNAELLKVSGTTVGTASGTPTAQAIAAGGTYRFRVWNFYGNTKTERIYGVDGVNRAFEFQDSPEHFLQIETGMPVDAPTHVATYGSVLWLAFRGGSLQPSSINDPCSYSALLGAAELAVGADVTNLLEEIANSLIVWCTDKTVQITGTSGAWSQKTIAIDSGAYADTAQRIGNTVYLDGRGFTTLEQTQKYGNFETSAFSVKIQTLIAEIASKAACSTVSKKNTLYRLFLNDGRILTIGFRGTDPIGHTIVDLGGVFATCAFSGRTLTDGELTVFGASNGFVYQIDSGINLDGAAIVAFMRTAFHFSRTPSRLKRYRRALFDVKPEGNCTLSIAPDYSFSAADVFPDPPATLTLVGGGGYWDVSLWDQFKWDSPAQAFAAMKLENAGTNIGFVFSHSSTNEPPHTVQGVSLQESARRIDRRTI